MMTKTGQYLLKQVLLIFLLGISTMAYSQSTTTTTTETVVDVDGRVTEKVTTTTTTYLETKIETDAPQIVNAGGFAEWQPLDCDMPVKTLPLKRMQENLRQRGYYTGAIDNVMGPKTRTAVIKFRVDNGHSEVYLVSECILALMGIILTPDERL